MQRSKHKSTGQLLGSIAAVAVAAGVLGAGIKPAGATPATLGFYPAPDIYPKGNFHLDVDTYGNGTRMDASTSYGLTYGIGPEKDGIFGRSEIGFDYVNTLGGSVPLNPDTGKNLSGTNRLLYNAKTQLYNNDKSGVRLVAGFWGVGSKDIFAPDVGYILGAKSFSWGRVSAGVAHSFAKDATISTLSGQHDKTYLHVAYDKMLTKKLQFVVDYYSGKSAISGVQPTLYYYVNEKASFGVGYFRLNSKDIFPTRNQVYLCFDYNFGGGSSTPEPAPAATATPANNKAAQPGSPATP